MVNKLISIISIIVAVSLLGFSIFFYKDNLRKAKTITRQDSLISKRLGDDKFDRKIEKLTDSIKTITEKISILIDNKEVSGEQIVAIINKIQQEKESIQEDLNLLQLKYNTAEKHYGFKFYVAKIDGKEYIKNEPSRADSSIILFKYFKDRIKKNNKGQWEVDVFGNETDKKKLRESLKPLTDTSKKN